MIYAVVLQRERTLMLTMYESEQQVPDRRCAAPVRSHVSLAAEQTDVVQWTADAMSVDLLAGHEHDQDVAVLNVHGEVDLETAPALRELLQSVLERQTGPIVVDLSEVSFMDSTGVHVLVDTLQRLEPQNRRLAIVCREGGQVHRLLALVGLLDALAVHRSRESAVTGDDDLLRCEPASDRRCLQHHRWTKSARRPNRRAPFMSADAANPSATPVRAEPIAKRRDASAADQLGVFGSTAGTTFLGAPRQTDRSFPSARYRPSRRHATTVNGRRSRPLHSVPDGIRSTSTIELLEMEPELSRLLTPERHAAAEHFLLPVTTVDTNADLEALLEDSHAFGALVLDGLLLQAVQLGTHQTLRLIGPGTLAPLERADDAVSIARSRLRPVDKARFVVLGEAFLIAAHRWPWLVVCLHERMLEQSARLTNQLAICQLPRVQDRLVAMLRLLAESWGRVTPAGIMLQLSLTHETLGGLIGARRPTVSLALKELAERNSVIRHDNGWLITGH